MPKRNAHRKIERYARKIRKLEEKEMRRRIISPIDSSSSDEGTENEDQVKGSCHKIAESTRAALDDARPESPINLNEGGSGPFAEATASIEPDFDPELLSALGEATSDSPGYGENIHDNLSKLWVPLLKKGMPKEEKDRLLKDYLVPENCKDLQAPKLNAEISAAVPDMVRSRDRKLTASQQQLGLGITAVNRGMDLLLRNDSKVQAIKHFSNGCRLLCDSHYLSTQSRIKLVTPNLDKSFLHMISESERDESLFGSKLPESIKAAKAIEKQGLSIKRPAKSQKPTVPYSSTKLTSYQGNWNAPPRYPANRGGRGGYNKRPPMTSGARRPYTVPVQPQRSATQDKPRAPAQSHR